MRTLAYTPSVEAYAQVGGGRESFSYIDLTPDVESCVVSINQDAASTCSLELANEGDKYAGVFEPMDMVTVFANKGEERNRVFTGYVNKVSESVLFSGGVSVSAKCPIYRLQELYWDPGLIESQFAMGKSMTGWSHADEIMSLLTDVGGVPRSQVVIESEIPAEVQELARGLYLAQARDVSDMDDMRAQFQDALMSSGTIASTTSATGGDYYGETQGIAAGETIEIPSSVSQSGVYTITPYQNFNWAYDQGKVFRKWKEQGSRFSDHIAVINAGGSDRLLIACTTTFGWNGDMLDFYLEGGIVLRTIMADAKSAGDANYSTWGHMTGGTTNVIEFEIDAVFWNEHHWNPGTNGWHEDWAGKRVVKVRNLGSIL